MNSMDLNDVYWAVFFLSNYIYSSYRPDPIKHNDFGPNCVYLFYGIIILMISKCMHIGCG